MPLFLQSAQFWRTALAFIIAPWPSISIITLLESGFQRILTGTFAVSVIASYTLIALLAVPIYCILYREIKLTLTLTAFLAGFIAVLPALIITTLFSLDPVSTNIKSNDAFIVENGKITWLGLWLNFLFCGKIFLLGALAGTVFWVIAGRRLNPA